MIFNTPAFFLFFCIFIVFYGFIVLRQTPRVFLILVGSLIFYGAWNYRFIPLLLGSGIADYFIAQAIANSNHQSIKKRWLILSLFINLGILALFKYADFVLQSVAELLLVFNYQADLPTLSWVLPVGISFYTFQSMSYTIDVYRGDMKPRKGLLEFVTALSFFPQLVAGPILRAKQILPQIHSIKLPEWDSARHGFLLITIGLVKKTGADLLAIPAEKVFANFDTLSTLEIWTGVLAFAGQIYGDFSGYTDMAIGLALLLGFKIPLNFRVPYFAISPVDFWRRWHISLSSWLRDYLYISLGGNRNGNRARNVFITMLLGGLWHGAAWTFIAWGAFHGAIITASHYLGNLVALKSFNRSNSFAIKLLKWSITFYLVLIGWVLFRAESIDSAWSIIQAMHRISDISIAASVKVIFLLVVLWNFLVHFIDFSVLKGTQNFESKPWKFWGLIIFAHVICLFIGAPSDDFIYFQF